VFRCFAVQSYNLFRYCANIFRIIFCCDALCVAYQEVAEGFGVLLLQCHVAVRLL